MRLTKEQECFVKDELIDIVWGNLECDWRNICTLISENTAAEFAGLEEEDVYELLRENLNCEVMKRDNSFHLPLIATYKNK